MLASCISLQFTLKQNTPVLGILRTLQLGKQRTKKQLCVYDAF